MYRRPKFLELLHEIRAEMSREANFDVEIFSEMVKNGEKSASKSNIETGNSIFSATILKELAEIEEQFRKSSK